MNAIEGGVLLVNKPYGWTSFDVVNKLRYALRKQTGLKNIKVGHAGTLDPLATGLLIICVGRQTKQIEQYMGLPKEYTGTFFLGATTPGYDAELEPDAYYPTAHITEALIHETARKFTGKIQQVPPVFSAVKVNGKPAYEKARKGHDTALQPREVEVSVFDITAVQMPEVNFRVQCSKGTYIRSLANDFGKALQSGAYLKALCRTAIGPYQLAEAKTVEECLQQIQNDEELKQKA